MTTFCPCSIMDILVESGPFGLYFEKYVAELDKLLPIIFWSVFVMYYINYRLRDLWYKEQKSICNGCNTNPMENDVKSGTNRTQKWTL